MVLLYSSVQVHACLLAFVCLRSSCMHVSLRKHVCGVSRTLKMFRALMNNTHDYFARAHVRMTECA